MCDCYICQRHKRFSELIVKYEIHEEDESWLRSIFNNLDNAEFDNDYYYCILHGDWPNAIVILDKAYKNAKDKKQREINGTCNTGWTRSKNT